MELNTGHDLPVGLSNGLVHLHNQPGVNGGMAASYHDLVAWQEAMRLVEMVYARTAAFPRQELFGLSAQLRRSAVSVPSNIAEGAARNSAKELFQFLGVASGSLAELQTQLEIAKRLGFLGVRSDCSEQADRVGRLLTGLRKSVRTRVS